MQTKPARHSTNKKIEQVLSLIDVTVLDHFIVGKHEILSIKELNLF